MDLSFLGVAPVGLGPSGGTAGPRGGTMGPRGGTVGPRGGAVGPRRGTVGTIAVFHRHGTRVLPSVIRHQRLLHETTTVARHHHLSFHTQTGEIAVIPHTQTGEIAVIPHTDR